MVSGFFTSPCDHSRIFSGLASEMRMALKESGSLGFSKKLKMSRMAQFSLKRGTRCFRVEGSGGVQGRQAPAPVDVTHGLLLLRRRRLGRHAARLDQLHVQAQALQLL